MIDNNNQQSASGKKSQGMQGDNYRQAIIYYIIGFAIQFIPLFRGITIDDADGYVYMAICTVGLISVYIGYSKLVPKPLNQPKEMNEENWKRVSIEVLDRVLETVAECRTKRSSVKKHGCLLALLTVAVAGVLIFITSTFISNQAPVMLVLALIVDAYLVVKPVFLSGVSDVFIPPLLEFKYDVLKQVRGHAADDGTFLSNYKLVPQIRFDRSEDELKQIPEDVRFLVESRLAPSDFICLQLTVTLNKGDTQSATHPYFYAVFVCQPNGKSSETLTRISRRDLPGNLILEKKSDEYDVFVLRDGVGWQTYSSENEEIIRLAMEYYEEICR